jgi:hypothetical protein
MQSEKICIDKVSVSSYSNVSEASIIWRVLEESQRIQLREKACCMTEEEEVPSAEWILRYKANLQKLLQVSFVRKKAVNFWITYWPIRTSMA